MIKIWLVTVRRLNGKNEIFKVCDSKEDAMYWRDWGRTQHPGTFDIQEHTITLE